VETTPPVLGAGVPLPSSVELHPNASATK
jgi:hypothetical protein